MQQCLAIWHYPHRTLEENVAFFADQGFDSVSILGYEMIKACETPESSRQLAEVIRQKGVGMTVHHKLPRSHGQEHLDFFYNSIRAFGEWQKEYGLMDILSFDVSDTVRDNIRPYVDFVLETVPNCKVALEDFGLNPREREQIEHLKAEPRFGYLLDIGHMYIRLCGKNTSGHTLFTNSTEECPATERPALRELQRAFASKEFPIFELHLHGNDGVGDQHLFLEDGELDMRHMAALLNSIDFDGVVTIESVPGHSYSYAGKEADQKILATYRYWLSLLAE